MITPEDPAKRAGTITVQFKGRDAVALAKALQATASTLRPGST